MLKNISSPLSHDPYGHRQHVWQGKSGRRYVHAVYPAGGCPELCDAVFVSVGRDATGNRQPLAIEGRAGFAGADLAATRRDRGMPGHRVDEVHVHFVTRARDGLLQAFEDLSAGFGLEPAALGVSAEA